MISKNYVRSAAACAIGLAALVVGTSAGATERHFTYTYQSETLGEGEREIEPWTTFRIGRDRFYSRLENRVEIEFGLTDRLQTSFYLNLANTTEADVHGQRVTRFEYTGVSSEWKYKLLDPVADALGMALYVEGGATTNAAELEAKLIFDKRFGDFLAALNLVGDYEWHFGDGSYKEKELEVDGGLVYFVSPHVSLGAEVVDSNVIGTEWESSALFAGPVATYSAESLWATLTVLPQLTNLKREAGTGSLELEDHEKLNVRLIFGAHF
jgi:hypothetical protein